MTSGAVIRSWRKAATKVVVFQCACGIEATNHWHFRAQPCRRAFLMDAPVSSMNTSRFGSIAGSTGAMLSRPPLHQAGPIQRRARPDPPALTRMPCAPGAWTGILPGSCPMPRKAAPNSKPVRPLSLANGDLRRIRVRSSSRLPAPG